MASTPGSSRRLSQEIDDRRERLERVVQQHVAAGQITSNRLSPVLTPLGDARE